MAHSKANEPVPIKVTLGLLSANTTRSAGVMLPAGHSVKSIEVTDAAAVTGDNTNRYSFSFNKGTIASPTAIATLDLVTGTNLVAHTPRSVSMTSVTDALKKIAATDVLHVVATKNGSASNTVFTEVVFNVVPTNLTRDNA